MIALALICFVISMATTIIGGCICNEPGSVERLFWIIVGGIFLIGYFYFKGQIS